MEYGFVYIWYDRKHKRYYIGCHWGPEDDGYICSSDWMKQAYKHRPNDFKRRILSRVYTNRKDLFAEEIYWHSLIKDEELKVRYYNLKKATEHWSVDPNKHLSVREKISKKSKENWATEEYRNNRPDYDRNVSSQEVREKKRQSMLKTMAEKYPVEDRLVRSEAGSEEHREKLSEASKKMWDERTEEEKINIGNKISEANKGLQNRLGQTNTAEHNRKISEAQKGRALSEEHKTNLKNAAKNRKGWSEEAKARHSKRIKEVWAKKKAMS